MNEASYTAWDDNLYEWPPPVGWYQADDGKWWPHGYGPTGDKPTSSNGDVGDALLYEVERTSIFPAGGSQLLGGSNEDRLQAESERPVYDELPNIDDVFASPSKSSSESSNEESESGDHRSADELVDAVGVDAAGVDAVGVDDGSSDADLELGDLGMGDAADNAGIIEIDSVDLEMIESQASDEKRGRAASELDEILADDLAVDPLVDDLGDGYFADEALPGELPVDPDDLGAGHVDGSAEPDVAADVAATVAAEELDEALSGDGFDIEVASSVPEQLEQSEDLLVEYQGEAYDEGVVDSEASHLDEDAHLDEDTVDKASPDGEEAPDDDRYDETYDEAYDDEHLEVEAYDGHGEDAGHVEAYEDDVEDGDPVVDGDAVDHYDSTDGDGDGDGDDEEVPTDDVALDDVALDDVALDELEPTGVEAAASVSGFHLGELPDESDDPGGRDPSDSAIADVGDEDLDRARYDDDADDVGTRSIWPMVAAVAVVVAVLFVALAFLLFDREETPGGFDAQAALAVQGEGSLSQPYPSGSGAIVYYPVGADGEERRWVIQIVEPASDQTEQVVAERGGVAPASGSILAVTTIRITYRSGPTPGPANDLKMTTIGSSLVLFDDDARCEGFTDQVDQTVELEPGQAIEGDLCWEVPESDLDDLKLAIEAGPVEGMVFVDLG